MISTGVLLIPSLVVSNLYFCSSILVSLTLSYILIVVIFFFFNCETGIVQRHSPKFFQRRLVITSAGCWRIAGKCYCMGTNLSSVLSL